jgi:methionyl-tRNA formyltransferase
MLKVIFLGNHTVGVTVLEELLTISQVCGVVAHPPDPEDGVVYKSVYDFALSHQIPVIRSRGKDENLKQFISEKNPDLLYITDFRYIIPPEIISLSRIGAVNMHPSKLPKYRGRASINWAILKGETEIGLTTHFVDAGVDTGDIIAQASIELNEEQDIQDALNLLYPKYRELTNKAIKILESGKYMGIKQDDSAATFFPKRTADDGKINFSDDPIQIRNLIRAVAPPYPGAFGFVDDEKFFILKARLVSNFENIPLLHPGEIYGLQESCFKIYLDRKNSLEVLSWKYSGAPVNGMIIR